MRVRTLTRRGFLRGAAAMALVPAAAACAEAPAATSGPVTVEMWHGQNDTGLKVLKQLVAAFQREHPDIRIDLGGGVLADAMLQKVTAALASGSYPDIAYIFGSDLSSIARSPRVADVDDVVHSGTEFWKPALEAVTVNGRVRAVPAMLDSLAVACNKTLFEQHGVPLPDDSWRWPDFVAAAKKLTDRNKGQFGTAWPGAGDEDTVWRLWPMIWDLGGTIVGQDGRSIGFADSGVQALEVIRNLAADRSVYIDPKPGSEQMYQAFASGRIAMVPTGPWQLPDIVDAGLDYHIVPLPTFTGNPITISGPDTWTVFDNGDRRLAAAKTFLRWLTAPAQDVVWDVGAGSLPLSTQSQRLPDWQRKSRDTAGISVFVKSLENSHVRANHPAYPQVSQAVAAAIVSVLLGRATPADAMRDCASAANAALVIPR
ncbi:ABC transporter substrate-binding protein [Amycolatopsis sp. WGS_07]|uniref:ABC transporter substrate-binding protein n=1 Tax=Amycolatopsis sp. WGS_07 TaxID=3076764 RepID=UPI003873163C